MMNYLTISAGLVASLLNCLHDLRQENQRLEERIGVLTARRDNLLAINARLSVPFGPPNNTHRSTATPHGIDSTSPEHHGGNRHANRSPRVNNCLPGDQNLRVNLIIILSLILLRRWCLRVGSDSGFSP